MARANNRERNGKGWDRNRIGNGQKNYNYE